MGKLWILVLTVGVLLGLVVWQFGGAGAIDSIASSVRCGAGQCPLRVAAATATTPGRTGVTWPPRLGEPYPDLELIDQTGQPVRLSSFKGSVILIEPVGMNCPACQSFAGAHHLGPYEGVAPQEGLPSIEELLPKYGRGVSLSDDRIVFVQLLLYSMTMGPPTPDDARQWAEHFRVERARNHVVLVGTKELLGPASYEMIPGFQLIDRSFILQVDSTGHQPRHDLFTELLPMVPRLLE